MIIIFEKRLWVMLIFGILYNEHCIQFSAYGLSNWKLYSSFLCIRNGNYWYFQNLSKAKSGFVIIDNVMSCVVIYLFFIFFWMFNQIIEKIELLRQSGIELENRNICALQKYVHGQNLKKKNNNNNTTVLVL